MGCYEVGIGEGSTGREGERGSKGVKKRKGKSVGYTMMDLVTNKEREREEMWEDGGRDRGSKGVR